MKMKPKTIITILLLTFVLGSVVFLIAGESLRKGKAPATTTNKETVTDTDPPSTLQREKAKEELLAASHKIAEIMYQQASAEGGAPGGPGAPGAGPTPPPGGGDDDVIDAEFEDANP